jgi:tetratricopeptide (TPR) repeat protein
MRPSFGLPVCVLPWVGLGPGLQARADELTERLLVALGKLGGLRVTSRPVSFAQKNRTGGAVELAARVGAHLLLEGALQARQGRAKATRSLVDGRTGYQIRTETLELPLENVADAPAELSRRLEPLLRSGPPVDESKSSEGASQLLLRGLHHLAKESPEHLRQAIAVLELAAARMPSDGHCQAGVAEAWALLPVVAGAPPSACYANALTAARRCLELDPRSAAGHRVLGIALLERGNGGAEGIAALEASLALDPWDGRTHRALAMHHLGPAGRLDEARAELARAAELEPLSAGVQADLAWISHCAADAPAAEEAARAAIRLDIGHPLAQRVLSAVLLGRGLIQEALQHARIAVELAPDSAPLQAHLALVLARHGDIDEAQAILRESCDADWAGFAAAPGRAATGEGEGALEALRRSISVRGTGVRWLLHSPEHRELRAHLSVDELARALHLDDGSALRMSKPSLLVSR